MTSRSVTLQPGFNLMAWLGADAVAAADATAVLGEALINAFAWDAVVQGFQTYTRGLIDILNSLETLTTTGALWVQL